MTTIETTQFVELDSTHGFPVTNRDSSMILTWGQSGAEIFDANSFDRKTIILPEETDWLSLCSARPLIGFSGKGCFGIIDDEGREYCMFSSGTQHGKYQNLCCFSGLGNRFWAVNNDHLFCVETHQKKVTADIDLTFLKQFANEGTALPLSYPTDDIIPIRLSAGQDFQGVFFGKITSSGLSWLATPRIPFTSVVDFSPIGDKILVVRGSIIRTVDFATGEKIGGLSLEEVFPSDPDGYNDEAFGDEVFYFSDSRAIVSTTESNALIIGFEPLVCKVAMSLRISQRLGFDDETVGFVTCSSLGKLFTCQRGKNGTFYLAAFDVNSLLE